MKVTEAKRLFCVRDRRGKIINDPDDHAREFFDSKDKAKDLRDAHGDGARVSRGPDHFLGASQ